MRRGVGIVIAALALCAPALPSASAAGIPRAQFCVPSTLVDYAPPAGLPAVRGLPPSSRLPFAPARLTIGRDQRPGLPPGVGLTSKPLEYVVGSIGAPVRADWLVESLLLPVSAKGKVGAKPAASRVQRIRGFPRFRSRFVGLRPGAFKPGLYRLDLLFRRATGKRKLLGRFSTYYEVSEPQSEFRLALNGSSFRAEEPVYVQVQNPGTDVLAYDDGYTLERLVGESWVPVVSQPAVAFGTYQLSLGRSDDCVTNYQVPRDAEPGRYRLTKQMWTFRPQTTVSASAEFTIE